MQKLKDFALYQEIISRPHHFEVSLAIGAAGRLVTERAERILFGGYGIMVGEGSADGGYKMNMLREVTIDRQLFEANNLGIGNAIASEINIVMQRPVAEITRATLLTPFIRAVDDEGNFSEWIQEGVFYLDTREYSEDFFTEDVITLHGYDVLLKAEAPYNGDLGTQNAYNTILQIANSLNAGVNAETLAMIQARNYSLNIGSNFTRRELLAQIAGMYGGNCTTDYEGNIKIIPMYSMPTETNLLMTEQFQTIVIGSDRIYV